MHYFWVAHVVTHCMAPRKQKNKKKEKEKIQNKSKKYRKKIKNIY